MLIGLHNRIEKAAATETEGQALALLRDTLLKGQFIECVQKQSVRQELRRIALHSAGKPFQNMRNEAFYLLDEEQHCARQGRESSRINSKLLEIAQMQQRLQNQVIELATQQSQKAGQNAGGDRLVTRLGQQARPCPTPEMAHVSIVGNRVISSKHVPRRGPDPSDVIVEVPPVSTACSRATLLRLPTEEVGRCEEQRA